MQNINLVVIESIYVEFLHLSVFKLNNWQISHNSQFYLITLSDCVRRKATVYGNCFT